MPKRKKNTAARFFCQAAASDEYEHIIIVFALYFNRLTLPSLFDIDTKSDGISAAVSPKSHFSDFEFGKPRFIRI